MKGLSFDKKGLPTAISLILFSIALVFVLPESLFGIYRMMYKSASLDDSAYLLQSAALLILMNCIRTTPCYLGVMVLAESISINKKTSFPLLFFLRLLLMTLLMIIIYSFINVIGGPRYDFGTPAVIVLVLCSMLKEKDLFPQQMIYKTTSIGMMIVSMQCLTIIPELTFLGFGRGEIASDIKLLATIMDRADILRVAGTSLGIIFAFSVSLILRLSHNGSKISRIIHEEEENKRRLIELQMQTLELRGFREIQNLVHDLKSPLTTIQGLASLTDMIESNATIKGYQQRICTSVDVMNEMISEILNEDCTRALSTDELCHLILSQTGTNERISKVIQFENRCPDALIQANKIRLTRAVINVIENAAFAVEKANPGHPEKQSIAFEVYRDNGDIVLKIRDNGVGIDSNNLQNIWTPGYSQRKSTGLGLAFSQSVLQNHGGTIEIDSQEGIFTTVKMKLKEIKSNEGN